MARRDGGSLNGDGDESLGGYGRYPKYLQLGTEMRIPRPLAALGRGIGAGVQRFPSRSRTLNRFGHLATRASVSHPADRYGRMMSWFLPEEKRALYRPEFRHEVGKSNTYQLFRDVWATNNRTDTANKLMACDVATYLR